MKPSLFWLPVLAMAAPLQAQDLGQHGQTYVLDADAREVLKGALRQKQGTGELDRFWQAYRTRTVESIKHPAPLGLQTSYAQKTEVHTLRYTFTSDIHDQNGLLLVKRGTVVEPLKLQPLHSALVFIDGRDQAQVDYAIARGRQQAMKIVLTAGSPYDLRLRYQRAAWWGASQSIPFYFDQRKMIIDTLARLYGVRIASVPVVLAQRGEQLQLQYGMGAAP